jgi:NADH dehydrogenase
MIDVTLVEAADRLLGTFSHLSSGRALRTLTRRGVSVVLGTGVDHLTAEGSTSPAGASCRRGPSWAAGVTAGPVAPRAASSRRGRAAGGGVGPVGAGRPEVFAIGDIAAAAGDDGQPLPQVAQPAIQGGRHVARQIIRRLDGLPALPFHYHDKGSMATIGRNEAITELPFGVRLWGFVGWLAWPGST